MIVTNDSIPVYPSILPLSCAQPLKEKCCKALLVGYGFRMKNGEVLAKRRIKISSAVQLWATNGLSMVKRPHLWRIKWFQLNLGRNKTYVAHVRLTGKQTLCSTPTCGKTSVDMGWSHKMCHFWAKHFPIDGFWNNVAAQPKCMRLICIQVKC